jgi:hypothetical protein
MSAVVGTIKAGVCGFVTEVTATSEDQQHVCLQVESTCDNINGLSGALPPELDAYAELGSGFDGQLWTTIRSCLKGCCSGCVVPAGLFKAMQIAAGLALPRAAGIEFEKPDPPHKGRG